MSNKKSQIYVWSNNTDKVNGQNIITRNVIESFFITKENQFFYYNDRPIDAFQAFFCSLKLFFASLLNKKFLIYLVCSRSIKGFIRDLPILILGILGRNIVVHVHGSDFNQMFKWNLLSIFVKKLYSKCHVIVPSYHLYYELDKKLFKSLNVIENFADVNIKESIIDHKDKFTILWNSNIQSSKGFIELIEAFKNILFEIHNVRLVITGECVSDYERNKAYMKNYLKKNLVTKNIIYLGRVNRSKMDSLLNQADLVVLPTTYRTECQPLALIEAMMYGLKIITTNIKPIKYTVNNYPVFFVKRSSNDVYLKIKQCYESRSESKKIYKLEALNSKNRFSKTLFLKKLETVFNKCIF